MSLSDITEVKATDIPAIREIQQEVWLATYPNKELDLTKEDILSRFTEETNKRFIANMQESLINNANIHGWIAKNKNIVIGFCFAQKLAERNRIMSLYILPFYQGQGIGKRLLQAAIDWLDNNKPITLEVASYNDNAIGFYKKFGFK